MKILILSEVWWLGHTIHYISSFHIVYCIATRLIGNRFFQRKINNSEVKSSDVMGYSILCVIILYINK